MPDKKHPIKYYTATCTIASEFTSMVQATDGDDARRKIKVLAQSGKLKAKNSRIIENSARFTYQNEFSVGSIVTHKKFGEGKVLDIEGSDQQSRISVMFNSDKEPKWLVAGYANLKKAGLSYYNWLQLQLDRGDWVADLAYDVNRDTAFPTNSNDLEIIKSYLLGNGAHSGAIEALDTSWLEYEESLA